MWFIIIIKLNVKVELEETRLEAGSTKGFGPSTEKLLNFGTTHVRLAMWAESRSQHRR
jgi:hypothetical protein